MRRLLFTLACAISLLLCAGVCVLWARSYWLLDSWFVRRGWTESIDRDPGHVLRMRTWRVTSNAGRLALDWDDLTEDLHPDDNRSDAHGYRLSHFEGKMHPGLFQRSGPLYRRVGFWSDSGPYQGRHTQGNAATYVAPHWLFVTLFAVLPLTYGVRMRTRALWDRSGRCRHCGYDLRATPDRCPECGEATGSSNDAA